MPRTQHQKRKLNKRGKTLKVELPKKGEILLFWNFIEQVHNNTEANNIEQKEEEKQKTTNTTKQKIVIQRRSINLRSRRVRL